MENAMQASLDRVMEAYEEKKPELLATLRERARELAHERGSVSVNDLRPYFDSLGYGGDPRVLGSVFREKGCWEPVATEPVAAPNSHPGHSVRRWTSLCP